jgi:hypothetical protein
MGRRASIGAEQFEAFVCDLADPLSLVRIAAALGSTQ